MSQGYPDSVQLVQMEKSIPNKSDQLINLKALSTMRDLWRYMDLEFVDTGEMARHDVKDIRSVSPTNLRYMQLMRNKLDPHWRNLSTVDLGKRIAGREAIEEKWIPLLDGKTRELWLQELVGKLKLWDRFMVFLNQRVKAARAREKI